MIKEIIKDKKGNGLILSCIVVLALSIIFFFIAEHSRTQMTISSVRDGLESVATNISTNNCDSIYQSQREGYFTSNILENDKLIIESKNSGAELTRIYSKDLI